MRTFLVSVLTLAICSAALSAADDVSGVVVDQSGHVVPRAWVRIVDARGGSAGTFADEMGRFRLARTPEPSCQVEATLAGFQPAAVPCGVNGAALRIELAVAPIREATIVTATRTEAPVSQVGASATVFTEADLERRQKPLVADLLTSTPGAMVVRSGQPGALTSLFVRGGESDYNKVLLDGVPLNEPGGTFYFSNLTTENIERIEILRGAYSTLFGSDAMGSVVQLFTKRADRTQRPHGAVQIDGGTYDTLHGSGSVSGGAGPVDYSLGVARLNSDNRLPNSRLENTTLSANVGVAVSRTATLRAVLRREDEHAGTPGPTAFGRPDLDAFADRADNVASVSFDQQSDRFRQRALYSRAASRQQSTNLIADPPFRATFEGRTATRLSTDFTNDSVNNLRRHHLGYQADFRVDGSGGWGNQFITALADWDGERARADNRLASTSTINTRHNGGVSLQDQLMWPRAFVTVGVRVEKNESFGTAVVPRATGVYVLHPSDGSIGDTQIKASVGTGIKEPTMLESFSVSPFFRGNADLKPERSRSAEVGISQRFAADRAKVELAYFYNRFSNQIALITTNPATFEALYQNIGVTRARGIELDAEARPIAALHLRAGYTLLDSKILESERPTDIVFGLGKQAFRRPRHSGHVGVSYSRQRVTADLNGVFVGTFVDSDFGLFNPQFLENPGHQLWDARLSLRLTSVFAALLAVDNLTNEDYSEPIGYQPLLRAVRVGVRIGF
jgi:vitamin B12 transporter